MRILVADDDEFFLSIAEEILTSAGHQVVLVKSGREALEKAVTAEPDLIILDVVMPGFLGTELCERLRRFERTSKVPIILISTHAAEFQEAEGGAEEFLADDFLPKPFQAEELLKRVERLAGSTSKFATQAAGTVSGSAQESEG